MNEDVKGKMCIEGVLWRKDGEVIPKQFLDAVKNYIIQDLAEKILFQVPLDWEGFKNGTAAAMGKSETDVYFAVTYITSSDDEVVIDFEGKPIEPFKAVKDGVPVLKYVKRTMCIIRKVNEKQGILMVDAFTIRLQYLDPLVKLVSMQCYSKDGLTCAENFLKTLKGLEAQNV